MVQQGKEADERACQAATLVSRRDSIIESFTQEHRMLLQLAEQFEGTALEMQQRRAIAGKYAGSVGGYSSIPRAERVGMYSKDF